MAEVSWFEIVGIGFMIVVIWLGFYAHFLENKNKK